MLVVIHHSNHSQTLHPLHKLQLAGQVAALPAHIVRRIREKGLFDTLRRSWFLTDQALRERWLGIDTQDYIPWQKICDDPACVDYDPIGYRTCRRALRMIDVDPAADVFVDYGCGKGRVVVLAARRRFRRVIGVELSAELADAARNNVAAARRRLRCAQVEIVQTNAKEYAIPPVASVFFLFNPFGGHILEAVQARLERSWRDHPRRIQVIYVHPHHVVNTFAQCDWLQETASLPSEGLQLALYRSR